MFALDTNVLVRLITRDDEAQYAAAARVVAEAQARGEPLLVTDAVLCETCWVLGRSYRQKRAALTSTLRELRRARHLDFEVPEAVSRALAAYAAGRGDFADYLIRERALAAGCDAVVTFDRVLHGEPGFAAPA